MAIFKKYFCHHIFIPFSLLEAKMTISALRQYRIPIEAPKACALGHTTQRAPRGLLGDPLSYFWVLEKEGGQKEKLERDKGKKESNLNE